MTGSELTLIEGAVLGLLVQQPRHGFALAKEFAPDGMIGGIFTARPPVVYRALRTLDEKDLVVGSPAEATATGPQRVVKHATEEGVSKVAEWVTTPVRHIRDVRIEFLVKLALCERLGIDPQPFIRRQYDVLRPIYEARRDEHVPAGAGFAHMRALWRKEYSQATMTFLERISDAAGTGVDTA